MHRAVFLLLVMILFMPLFCGQAQQRPAPHQLHLVLGPFDPYTRSFGLDDDKVFRCARDVLMSQKFVIDEKSTIMVSVTISSLPQSDEDYYRFRIEAHAGTRPSLIKEDAEPPPGIGDIPGFKDVSESMNNDTKILGAVREVVSAVGVKLRKEMDRLRTAAKQK